MDLTPGMAYPIQAFLKLRRNTGQPTLTLPLNTTMPGRGPSRTSGPIPLANKDLVASLTLEQKIAQLMMIPLVVDEEINQTFMANSPYKMDQSHIERLIQEYGIGSVIIMGKGTQEKVQSYIDRLQGLAQFPLLVGIDAEWGLSMRLENTLRFPRAMTLGALASKNYELIQKLGRVIGKSCKELGIGINFAPVVDVNPPFTYETGKESKPPYINTRSFGDDPIRVAFQAGKFAQGLREAGILACAKHFPGHGATTTDSHCTLPLIAWDREQLDKIDLRPFRELIKQGIPAIMIAHLLVPALDETMPSSASFEITTNLLQGELGFNGLIITDGLGMGALLEQYKTGEIECNALLAGNDILLGVMNVPHTINLVKQAINDGKITEQEIERRVLKVLKAKDWIHEHRNDRTSAINQTNLKREIYRQAIALIKNNQNILPFKPEEPLDIRVYGLSQSFKFADVLQKHVHQTKDRASAVVLAIYPIAKKCMIDEQTKEERSNEPISLTTEISELRKYYTNIIAVLFDSPYRIAEIETADAIICAHEDDPDAQEGAALTLLGYHNPSGVLPISIGQDFRVGTKLSYPTMQSSK